MDWWYIIFGTLSGSDGDYLVYIREAFIAGFLALIFHQLRKKVKTWDENVMKTDQHLVECTHHSRDIENRINETEEAVRNTRNDVRWIGDCIMRIGGKMDIELPNRPSRR